MIFKINLPKERAFVKSQAFQIKVPQPFLLKSRHIARQFKQSPRDVFLMVAFIAKTASTSGYALPVAIKIQSSTAIYANTAMKPAPIRRGRIVSN